MSRSSSDETLILLFVISTIIVVIIEIVTYIAVPILIIIGCITMFGLFCKIFQYYYIGTIDNVQADPLLTKISKWVVTKERVDVTDLMDCFSVDYDRGLFIITQLNLMGLLSGSICLVKSKWSLRKIFLLLNKDEFYFTHSIDDKSRLIIDRIDNQLNDEKNLYTFSLLNYYRKYCNALMHLSYLKEESHSLISYKKNNTTLNNIEESIKYYESIINGKYINIKVDEGKKKSYDRLCKALLNIDGKTVWNSQHVNVRCESNHFLFAHINGEESSFPCIRMNEYKVYYFLPQCVVIFNTKRKNRYLKCIDYKQIITKCENQYLTKEKWFDETILQVAYYTYLHSRVDGGPDRRYKYNPSTAYYLFYNWSVPSIGLELIFTNGNTIDTIESEINRLRKTSIMKQFSFLDDHECSDLSISKVKTDNNYSRRILKQNRFSEKIEEVIKCNYISVNTLKKGTLAYILNDLQVFQTVEEKSYFRIMKSLIGDGILEKIMESSPDSLEGKRIVDNYVMSSGYDLDKVRSVVVGVYYGFVDSANT